MFLVVNKYQSDGVFSVDQQTQRSSSQSKIQTLKTFNRQSLSNVPT